ncbi:MAG: amidohydrolase family protein [Hyphomicrobiales bacterium]|nr:amidohydrolase family protein [Hyphomicrobiales bacterium]
MRLIRAATAALSVAIATFAVPARTQTGITVYENARLIVGDGRVIENGVLVVDGARIAQVGSAAEVKAPAGVKRVSLAGKTVMPMLIDTHVHLSSKREALVRDLKQRAYWGVNAAVSMGTDNIELLALRNETIPGAARFLSAGRGITRNEPLRPTFQINSDDEARKAVQQNATWKVDLIKFWVDDRNGKVDKITPSQYMAIINEAKKLNLRVSAHIYNMSDAKGLMRAGIYSLAHGVRDLDFDDETAALFKERPHLFVIPNLPDRGVKVDRRWVQAGMSAEEFAKLEAQNTDRPQAQALHGIQARNLARMNKTGIRITMGTDGNRPWGAHEEMEDMVLAGMTPMEVIIAATRTGAAFVALSDIGTLEAGKSADLLVLDANPLDNITNTRRIAAVILRGEPLDRSKPVP